jgi:hypothetical protein
MKGRVACLEWNPTPRLERPPLRIRDSAPLPEPWRELSQAAGDAVTSSNGSLLAEPTVPCYIRP